MASQPGDDVYATLLLEDSYLPGALVLAHSLKDAGTTKKIAVLVTTETVSAESRRELETVFDIIIPVDRVVNENTDNLNLMGRPDLHSTFTKITLWKQTQFRRIVYMDADMVALRAPDELFELPQPFSAAPDIGWPDIFNTGLMVLNPNMSDYQSLYAMAQRGISFDGADQGLLNMHFKDTFNRLSFTYNVTPSPHYQYLPAFKHFQSSISAAHYIGPNKPWKLGRTGSDSTPYGQMIGQWWAVYDKHYKESSSNSTGPSPYVQYWVKGEYSPFGNQAQGDRLPYTPWDASKAPPPSQSRPEAGNFQGAHYEMSNDATPFRAPSRYPDPPRNMYYEVPSAPRYQRPAPIFPWEKDAPQATRVFAEDLIDEVPQTPTSTAATGESFPATPTTPTISVTGADPWQSYNRGNAWDEIPEIERYVGNLTKNRRAQVQILHGSELERPSLPVTPAPRPSFWGEERNEDGNLPAAEGVPAQQDWDPAAQLDMLARRQSDVLAQQLDLTKELPARSLPYGSEGAKSPTYVAQGPGGANAGSNPRTVIQEPAYHGPGALWEKNENIPTRETPMPPSEEEKDVLMT